MSSFIGKCWEMTPMRDEATGCVVWVDDGALMSNVIMADGSVEDDPGEITAPVDQAFLDRVNTHFGTVFEMEHFAGR